jgi:hypothetical protein
MFETALINVSTLLSVGGMHGVLWMPALRGM